MFHQKPVGPLKCNMCIIGDPKTRNAVLVDPGGDAGEIMKLVNNLKVTIVQILVTHAHFDHFLAAGEIRKLTKSPIFLHKADLELWRMLPMQCMLFRIDAPAERIADPDQWLDDGSKLKVLDGVVIHTPGHSPGSSCFYFAESKLLFTGDTLFRASIGRTDLLGGDPKKIVESIQKKLYTLPDDINVTPGHGESTTIGYEKQNNMVVRAKSAL